jgi:3',5'-cyclic AMP phosphodiesterase CpdA
VLKRRGVELVLHGHDHIHSTMWLEGADRQIPAVGVPSASALAHRHYPAAAYNLFSSEVDTGSREENASKQESRAASPA